MKIAEEYIGVLMRGDFRTDAKRCRWLERHEQKVGKKLHCWRAGGGSESGDAEVRAGGELRRRQIGLGERDGV